MQRTPCGWVQFGSAVATLIGAAVPGQQQLAWHHHSRFHTAVVPKQRTNTQHSNTAVLNLVLQSSITPGADSPP